VSRAAAHRRQWLVLLEHWGRDGRRRSWIETFVWYKYVCMCVCAQGTDKGVDNKVLLYLLKCWRWWFMSVVLAEGNRHNTNKHNDKIYPQIWNSIVLRNNKYDLLNYCWNGGEKPLKVYAGRAVTKWRSRLRCVQKPNALVRRGDDGLTTTRFVASNRLFVAAYLLYDVLKRFIVMAGLMKTEWNDNG